MAHKTDRSTAHAPLPLDIADRLLDLLASNDDFRSTFQANPAAALSHLGYAPAQAVAAHTPRKGDPFYCMTSNTLASKEEIARAREELLGYLTAAGNHHIVFSMETGKIDTITYNFLPRKNNTFHTAATFNS